VSDEVIDEGAHLHRHQPVVRIGGFGARRRRHASRNVGDQPARALILSAPSCGLDQMFAELDAATAKGMPEMEKMVPSPPNMESPSSRLPREMARPVTNRASVLALCSSTGCE
jgi:hypothetical protein